MRKSAPGIRGKVGRPGARETCALLHTWSLWALVHGVFMACWVSALSRRSATNSRWLHPGFAKSKSGRKFASTALGSLVSGPPGRQAERGGRATRRCQATGPCEPCIQLSIYLCIYVSIYLSIHLSIYLSIHLSINPSIYRDRSTEYRVSIHLSTHDLSIYHQVTGRNFSWACCSPRCTLCWSRPSTTSCRRCSGYAPTPPTRVASPPRDGPSPFTSSATTRSSRTCAPCFEATPRARATRHRRRTR